MKVDSRNPRMLGMSFINGRPQDNRTELVSLFLSADAVLAERRVGVAGLGAVLEGGAESVLRLPRPPRAVPAPPA